MPIVNLSENNKIHGIQYLRGFAALLVVIWHSWWTLGPEWKLIVNHFFIGVDIFFVISGFIIYMITAPEINMSVKSFIYKRFFRIYPAFAITWLILFIARFSNASFYEALRSLLLFHVDYSSPAPAFNYNKIVPAWTLTYEIYFYAIFLASCCISRKYRALISSALIISLSVGFQLAYNGKFEFSSTISANTGSNSMLLAPVSVLSCTMMWEFIAGMLIAWIYKACKEIKISIAPLFKALVSLVLIAFFLYNLFSDKTLPQGLTGLLAPSVSLVLGVLILTDTLRFELKPLSFIGDISYSIYLSHWIVVCLVPVIYPQLWLVIPKPINLIVFIALTFALSVLMHFYIEKPAIRCCRRLLSSSRDKDKKYIDISTAT